MRTFDLEEKNSMNLVTGKCIFHKTGLGLITIYKYMLSNTNNILEFFKKNLALNSSEQLNKKKDR